MRKYYGKYRGKVINNLDPEQRGRIQAAVPAVTAVVQNTWAMPCVPIAGQGDGFFAVPQLGADVWIEFEQSEIEKPIWVGGFWNSGGELPASALVPAPVPPGQNVVLQTNGNNAIVLSDSPPTPSSSGVILKDNSGAIIVINESGIHISNGKGATLTLVGPAVTINNGAMEIV